MKYPTGSSLERAAQCPGSFHLPQVGRTTEAALKGTENHSAAEKAVDQGTWDNLPPIARALMEGHVLLGHVARSEVTYAIDPKLGTVRELGAKLNRNYGDKREGEIVLTLDLVCGPLVLDWKSRTRVTKAKENWQIRAGIYAVAVLGGFSEMKGGLVYLSDGWADMASFDSFDLDAIADELKALLLDLEKGEGKLHEGDWCLYCPAFTSCPAKTSLVKALGNGEIPEIVDGDFASAWHKVKRAKEALERVEDAIKDRVKNQGDLVISDKKRLSVVNESRTSLDTKRAKEALTAAGLPVPERTTSFQKVMEKNL